MFDPSVVDGLQAPALKAELSADDALAKLLTGTKLHAVRVDANTVRVVAGPSPQHTASSRAPNANAGYTPATLRVADAAATDQSTVIASSVPQDSTDSNEGREPPNHRGRLEEIVVTGSRLARPRDGPQETQIYSSAQIDNSGQTTVSDFLNTIPLASTAVAEDGYRTNNGGTSVQLHGLPIGTTLVLLNGRRLETSGTQSSYDFFDLNNIPLEAVQRIEVLSGGASAVYGSDAIAGVVNVVLKNDFDGISGTSKYGDADGIHETNASFSLGNRGERGSVSLVATYQDRTELNSTQRSLTSSNDYTRFGGFNNNFPVCSPGNVFSVDGSNLPGLNAPYAAVPRGYKGSPSIAEFQSTAGALNTCAINQGSLIPATTRYGLVGQGRYRIGGDTEVFAEFLYSHVAQNWLVRYPSLFGEEGFQQFTVGPTNPFNPFGTTVGVSEQFLSLPRIGYIDHTDFLHPVIGARGAFANTWRWELTASESVDWTREDLQNQVSDASAIQAALNSPDPASALNPFVNAASGSQALLKTFFSDGLVKYSGREESLNGFVRGNALSLPGGPVQVVFGAEYHREGLTSDQVNDGIDPLNTRSNTHRSIYAVFSETRIPIWAGSRVGNDILAVTAAGRFDHYSDFGGTTNPQFGVEWRPVYGVLVRGTYGRSFKAPSLYSLYSPQTISPSVALNDAVDGRQILVTEVTGGNPLLRPETGRSHTIGLSWASEAVDNLSVAVTQWQVTLRNAITQVPAQLILNYENLFPGNVTRDANGNVTQVVDEFVNFGEFDVAGIDYQVRYALDTSIGRFSPSLNATQTYRYQETLTPGTPAVNAAGAAQGTGDWAPRWKATAATGWALRPVAINLQGRYVSTYQDYDSTQKIGDFWLFDANLRVNFETLLRGMTPRLKGLFVEVGGINIFDRLPQYSRFSPVLGYDPTQADIRGRFLYLKVGATL